LFGPYDLEFELPFEKISELDELFDEMIEPGNSEAIEKY